VLSLSKTIASLARNRDKWNRRMRAAGLMHARDAEAAATALEEVHGFGSNPGNLRMLTYVPANLPADPGLVVVLHGCKQTAAGYDHGAGWSTLAERYGFALLLPEQQQANNPNTCFNWFNPADARRGRGEALSIRQMIERMVVDHGIDRDRVFVTGLSAGGAMTSVMLACYPEVFAGGAIVAGLPYGTATNVQQAFESMFHSPPRPARDWGDLVRAASPHEGPWPRISVWHGNADTTVIPANADAIVAQWVDVHGLPMTPSMQAMVDGYPRQVWVNGAGDELIESYTITDMAHGTPLATSETEGMCGAAGPFLLEAGISSSYHIARFFGLTAGGARRAPRPRREAPPAPPPRPVEEPVAASEPATEADVLEKDANARADSRPAPERIDIGAIINKALRAAGLIRNH
jgi:poly(hydroxyalkanoate) depolymerase family esterase